MRTVSFLSILFITILLLSAQTSVFSEEKGKDTRNYSYSLGLTYGFIYGKAKELVYPVDTKAKYLSELLWDMKPVFYYGAKFDIGKKNIMDRAGFFTSMSFKIGIPADSGKMEDRDWTSKKNDNLTHFSSHTNKTKEYYCADILIGVSIPIKTYLYIKPFLSGSWMHFAFSGRDGYRTYEYENWEVIPFEGEVITYKQDWFLAAVGFSIGTNIVKPLAFELFFHISPLTYCDAKDEHLKTNIVYVDRTSFGLFIESKLLISVILDRLIISLEGSYRYIGDTKGPAYRDSGNTGIYFSNGKAGSGLSMFDISLAFKIKI